MISAPAPLPPSRPPAALGWLLLLPAVVAALICLVVPSVHTVVMSLRDGRMLNLQKFVGLDNYADVLGGSGFWRGLFFSVAVMVVPLLVALVAGTLTALALDRGGSWVRRTGLVVFSLVIVTFSPLAVVVAWSLGVMPGTTGIATLIKEADSSATFLVVVAAMTFGVVCAAATLVFLPALRGGSPARSTAVVGVLVLITMLAVGLQAFTFSAALSRSGPDGSKMLAPMMFTQTFQVGRFGLGATLATLTGVMVGVLGLVAVIAVVLSGMRLHLAERAPDRAPASRVVIGALALVVVVAIAVALAWPWISQVLSPEVAAEGQLEPAATMGTYVRTWGPALVGALVSVGVAYLAALGIGGLRPLGRHSEWLLLLFAPWLLVGVGPLSLPAWTYLRDLDLLNTVLALIPPMMVSVPALVVLTLLCRGLAERAQTGFLRGVVLPSLPMAGVLAGVVTLVNAQEWYWPMLVAQEPETWPASLFLGASRAAYRGGIPDVGIMTPLPVMLIALAAAIAAQLLYLDRLAITVGRKA